jgi:FKBP-type peptidyl-prolyl cis-trans isomerase SlyD
MKASHGSVVTFNYTVTDDEGKVLDTSDTPVSYLHGYGEIIPRLEHVLEGAEPGRHEAVVIQPADAYGERDESAIVSVPIESIPADVRLEPGMDVVGETPDGMMRMTVREIKDDEIIVDANHPLAGKTLHFDVDVVDVHEASGQELADAGYSGDGGAAGKAGAEESGGTGTGAG